MQFFFKNQQSKSWSWSMNFKYILDQQKQPIDLNKYEHPTGTLAKKILNPAGEENPYVWFGCVPQKIAITPKDNYQDQWVLVRSM